MVKDQFSTRNRKMQKGRNVKLILLFFIQYLVSIGGKLVNLILRRAVTYTW